MLDSIGEGGVVPKTFDEPVAGSSAVAPSRGVGHDNKSGSDEVRGLTSVRRPGALNTVLACDILAGRGVVACSQDL